MKYNKNFLKEWFNKPKKTLTAEVLARKKRNSWILFAMLVLCRFFFIEYFKVPSSSMTPTLLTGDVILAKKYAYSWSRMSLLFGGYLPYFKKGLVFNQPKRGDMAVFIMNIDPSTYYVKRIVAIEGDTVQMKNGVLHINDLPCEMKFNKNFMFRNDYNQDEVGQEYQVTQPKELGGATYKVYRNLPFGRGIIDNTLSYKIPKGHVWCQGDFNTGSRDSFDTYFMGPVPVENLVGKPFFVLFGTNSRPPAQPSWILWGLNFPKDFLIALIKTNPDRIFKFVK